MITKLENATALLPAVLIASNDWQSIINYLLKSEDAQSLVNEDLRKELSKLSNKVDAWLDEDTDESEADAMVRFDVEALELLNKHFHDYPVYMEMFKYGTATDEVLSMSFYTEKDIIWDARSLRKAVGDEAYDNAMRFMPENMKEKK